LAHSYQISDQYLDFTIFDNFIKTGRAGLGDPAPLSHRPRVTIEMNDWSFDAFKFNDWTGFVVNNNILILWVRVWFQLTSGLGSVNYYITQMDNDK